MVFAASRSHIRTLHLKSAIFRESRNGHRNVIGGKTRYISSKFSSWSYESKKLALQKFLEEMKHGDAASVLESSNILDRVSTFMGYDNLHDLIEHEYGQGDTKDNPKRISSELDIFLACSKFPSIILGDTPLVELYGDFSDISHGTTIFLEEGSKGCLPIPVDHTDIGLDNIDESWGAFANSLSNATSPVLDNNEMNMIPSVPEIPSQGVKEVQELLSAVNETEEPVNFSLGEDMVKDTDALERDEAVIPDILDKSINALPGISKKHARQLEKNGFHTVRKLLKHFPRTYADIHNSQDAVYDGCYLIFVGKVSSSRGIRISTSLALLDIVVTCEISNGKCNSNMQSGSLSEESARNIKLHLKKYFSGRRFTSNSFLRCIETKHKAGDLVSVSGKSLVIATDQATFLCPYGERVSYLIMVKAMKTKDHFEIREYNIDVIEEDASGSDGAKMEERPYPIYPCKGGLNSNFYKDHILRALHSLSPSIDPIPNDICEDFSLMNLYDAYLGIHCPRDLKEADFARRRMIFDEFFYLQLARLFQMYDALGTPLERARFLDKFKDDQHCFLSVEEFSHLTKELMKALPYQLTQSQAHCASEIISDLRRAVPMHRLLQGDVGCGKTVVAFMACMEVIDSGYQAAFMVPTELLACQHYEQIVSLLGNMRDVRKPTLALLTGSTSSKESRFIRKGLQNGDIDLIIGTHTLISEGVEFLALRLAVIDEQHRFGVIQRGRFNSKLYSNSDILQMLSKKEELSTEKNFMAPHILAISATPIPRTLALILYGDMSLSQITDLPPGRLPVETYAFEENQAGLERMYQIMQSELQTGGKVYLVYPVIEESEHLPQLHAATAELALISSKFKDYQCGLLHGRMKSDEKETTLQMFRSGEIQVLLSTQVIEIGVDVPDASMMVVMNAERFGIAQLHQLRGRVGRGLRKSICILLSSSRGTLARLKVLEGSSDGFHLANVDLLHRGPGDLLGKKQSGHLPDFPLARLEVDGNILKEAQLAALNLTSLEMQKILRSRCGLDSLPRLKAELSMRHPLCVLGD